MDETEFACAEKARILLKLSPPGSENAIIDNYVPIFRPGEYKIRHLDDKGRFKDNEEKKVWNLCKSSLIDTKANEAI